VLGRERNLRLLGTLTALHLGNSQGAFIIIA
jgi:hypothetical protein